MAKSFASQGDLEEKRASFVELAPGAYAYTAEGDPNAGVIIGDASVMVVDARATPVLAAELIAEIRRVTDKPISHVVLTHYHAVRVLGASAYGARDVIASDPTLDLIRERGAADWASEVQRFPRLFKAADSVPGLTWPTLAFSRAMTVFLGRREVRIIHPGAGHTAGDTVVWLPEERVLFAGDLVEQGATPYCGDAHLAAWPGTLDALRLLEAERLVPGRGEALMDAAACEAAIRGTQGFVERLLAEARSAVGAGQTLKHCYDRTLAALRPDYGQWVIFDHCMPFNVARAYDEASGIAHPRIWTAARDLELWRALEDPRAVA